MKRDTPSMLWDRLHKHERHVQLAPLTKDKNSSMLKEKRFSERPPERAWVKIRFSLQNPLVNQKQIEDLAREFPAAFERANIKGLRRIDWLKMEMMESNSLRSLSLSGVATSAVAMSRMRSRSRSRASLRSNSDQADEVSPISNHPKLRLDSTMTSPGRSSTLSPGWESYPSARSSSETFGSGRSDEQSLDSSD